MEGESEGTEDPPLALRKWEPSEVAGRMVFIGADLKTMTAVL